MKTFNYGDIVRYTPTNATCIVVGTLKTKSRYRTKLLVERLRKRRSKRGDGYVLTRTLVLTADCERGTEQDLSRVKAWKATLDLTASRYHDYIENFVPPLRNRVKTKEVYGREN